MVNFPDKIFVTGTDTDVGKTVVSAIVMAGLKAAYWKPVQSGLVDVTDTDWVRKATGFSDDHFVPETYRLSRPLSPHAAASHDGIRIDLERFQLPKNLPGSHLIVEGAGGVMVPLNDTHFMVDLMKQLGLPVLLVARSTLGTINHTLMSLEFLRKNGLLVYGVVMNGPRDAINRKAIETYGRVPVMAEVETLPQISLALLEKAYIRFFKEIQIEGACRV